MLPLPSLFSSFEGFVLSLLLTQSHRKKKKSEKTYCQTVCDKL